MTQNEAILKIKNRVGRIGRFRIGKTGQDLSDHFQSLYHEEYDDIFAVCHSDDPDVIYHWERGLIRYFKETPEYSYRCDNHAPDEDDMDTSKIYRIYVVTGKKPTLLKEWGWK